MALVHSILQRHITSTLQSWQLWTDKGGITESQGAGKGGSQGGREGARGQVREGGSQGAGEGGREPGGR